jgi:hypothetical protein
MVIKHVRLANPIALGTEVVPDSFLIRGKRLASSQIEDLQMYDAMFLKITYNCPRSETCPSGVYSQFIPWAQVATVYFDDTVTEKSST